MSITCTKWITNLLHFENSAKFQCILILELVVSINSDL